MVLLDDLAMINSYSLFFGSLKVRITFGRVCLAVRILTFDDKSRGYDLDFRKADAEDVQFKEMNQRKRPRNVLAILVLRVWFPFHLDNKMAVLSGSSSTVHF